MAKDTKAPPEETKKAVKAAAEATKNLWEKATKGKLFSKVGKEEAEAVSDIKKTIGGLKEKLGNASANAAKGLEEKIGTASEKLKTATEALHKVKLDTFKEELSIGERQYAKVAANIGQASTGMKIVRGGAALGGLIVIGSGVKNLIAAERDENGERKGSAWKQVGKIGAGGAALYASLIYGGANKAMGI